MCVHTGRFALSSFSLLSQTGPETVERATLMCLDKVAPVPVWGWAISWLTLEKLLSSPPPHTLTGPFSARKEK